MTATVTDQQHVALPTDRYEVQDQFHTINLGFPGLRLIHNDPFIFAIDGFVSEAECKALQQQIHSCTAQSSATAPEQEAIRTSTSVFPAEADLRWLRERICTATNVALSQLEPTKLTIYQPGEYFRKHTDASFLNEKMWAFAARSAGVDEEGVQDPCHWPSRFCTLFLYLNDVAAGGRTCFRWLDGSGSMPGGGIFEESIEQLGTACASAPPVASSTTGSSGSAQLGGIMELNIVPRAGVAIIHFPTTRLKHGCIPDPRTMHESEDAIEPKAILQQFIWPCPIEVPSDFDSKAGPCEEKIQEQGQGQDQGQDQDQDQDQNQEEEEEQQQQENQVEGFCQIGSKRAEEEHGRGSGMNGLQARWHPDVYLEWRAILAHTGQ